MTSNTEDTLTQCCLKKDNCVAAGGSGNNTSDTWFPTEEEFQGHTYSCFSRNCICHDNEAPTAISWPWSPLALDNGLKLDQSDHLPLKFGLWPQMRELGVISNQSKKNGSTEDPHSPLQRHSVPISSSHIERSSDQLLFVSHETSPYTTCILWVLPFFVVFWSFGFDWLSVILISLKIT